MKVTRICMPIQHGNTYEYEHLTGHFINSHRLEKVYSAHGHHTNSLGEDSVYLLYNGT